MFALTAQELLDYPRPNRLRVVSTPIGSPSRVNGHPPLILEASLVANADGVRPMVYLVTEDRPGAGWPLFTHENVTVVLDGPRTQPH